MHPDAVYTWVIAGIWLTWCLYWFVVAARGVKADARRESPLSRLSHIVPLLVGIALIALPRPITILPWMQLRLWQASAATYWIGVCLLMAGLAFTVWARVHLGRNWSGTITVKEGHELVRSGPYALVRHPIYTGLLIAVFGCVVARGELRGLAGFAIVVLSLKGKSLIEERWMAQQFGTQYERYRSEVGALLPRFPPRR